MRYLLFLIGILFCFAGRLSAQYEYQPTFEDTLQVYEDLFGLEEPMYFTMKTNLKKFKKTRRDEKYQPAELTCHVNDTFQVTHPVRIKARGIFRRDNCTLPPFWLNIRYAGIEADSIRDINRLKMVIRCKKSQPYDYYILREYLVYKLYSLITPYSFRVRLVHLNIMDTGSENSLSEDWAFIIEPEELLQERLNCVVMKIDKLSIRTVNRDMMDKVALFQYMIGNGDFSVTGRHNLKILTLKDQHIPGFVPLPYDFDYCGLVNTVYAQPQESLGIESVRERYFLGPCRSREIQREAIQNFALYRDEMIEYVHRFEFLNEEEKMDMIAYVESYFSEAEDEKFIERHLAPSCR